MCLSLSLVLLCIEVYALGLSHPPSKCCSRALGNSGSLLLTPQPDKLILSGKWVECWLLLSFFILVTTHCTQKSFLVCGWYSILSFLHQRNLSQFIFLYAFRNLRCDLHLIFEVMVLIHHQLCNKSLELYSCKSELIYPLNNNFQFLSSPLVTIILCSVAIKLATLGTSSSGIIQYLSFHGWLILLRIMSLRFIHVASCGWGFSLVK